MLQDDWKNFGISDVARIVKKLLKCKAVMFTGEKLEVNNQIIDEWKRTTPTFTDAPEPEYYAMVISLLKMKTGRDKFETLEIIRHADEGFVLLGLAKQSVPFTSKEILVQIKTNRRREILKQTATFLVEFATLSSVVLLPLNLVMMPITFAVLAMGLLAKTRGEALRGSYVLALFSSAALSLLGESTFYTVLPVHPLLSVLLINIFIGLVASTGFLLRDTYIQIGGYNEWLEKKKTKNQ